MSGPVRIQLSRAKGFNLQETSLALNSLPCAKVDRSTRLGNPFVCHFRPGANDAWCSRCDPEATYCCLVTFREYAESGIEGRASRTGSMLAGFDALAGYPGRKKLVEALAGVRGKNVACWCALDRPCHGDIILELANPKEPS